MFKTKVMFMSLFVLSVCVLGFAFQSPAAVESMGCDLGGEISGETCTSSSSVSGSFQTNGSWVAASVFSGTNLDEVVRVKVSAVVKLNGSTIANQNRQITCSPAGCDNVNTTLFGSFNTCTSGNSPDVVTISSTHEYQRIGGSTHSESTSDSHSYLCP